MQQLSITHLLLTFRRDQFNLLFYGQADGKINMAINNNGRSVEIIKIIISNSRSVKKY